MSGYNAAIVARSENTWRHLLRFIHAGGLTIFVASTRKQVKMKIIIQCQESHAVEVTGDETVAFLKNYLHTAEGIVPEDQRLYAEGGKPLNDADLLSACLTDGALVNAVVPLVGGKVHGSLARAGKVKGQTPKVEKQEKKKKKTGRAKRRIQYNRRFVNAVATFGRRRGPNANQAS
ncbi:ubiquitin-like FUBI-ribosomal protein eS30 fusion protein isoform X1 [Dermacentor albipictus]|uniref:ubiquitin-like FUBI-ribosomal protein eS30 fusion protein isoform X1 n=1 Tax=Dermacentor albipictus TaxID=60249 RepID=UPI0038FC0371